MNPYGTTRLYRGALKPLDRDTLEWQDAALCAQVDPNEWFPEKGKSTRQAKQVCRGCPVRAECLDYALEHGELYGVWGGLSPEERVIVNAGGSSVADIIAVADEAFYARLEKTP